MDCKHHEFRPDNSFLMQMKERPANCGTCIKWVWEKEICIHYNPDGVKGNTSDRA